MKVKFLVCHKTLLSYSVLVGFIHIWTKDPEKTYSILTWWVPQCNYKSYDFPLGYYHIIFVIEECKQMKILKKTDTYRTWNMELSN